MSGRDRLREEQQQRRYPPDDRGAYGSPRDYDGRDRRGREEGGHQERDAGFRDDRRPDGRGDGRFQDGSQYSDGSRGERSRRDNDRRPDRRYDDDRDRRDPRGGDGRPMGDGYRVDGGRDRERERDYRRPDASRSRDDGRGDLRAYRGAGGERSAELPAPGQALAGNGYRPQRSDRRIEPAVPVGSPADQSDGPFESFFDEVESVQRGIDRIGRSIQQIKALQSRALISASASESSAINRELDDVSEQTSSLLQSLRGRVRTMANQTKKMPPSAEAHSRRGQQATLAKKLLEVANGFQKCQADFKQKSKQRMEREIKIARPDATPAEVQRAVEGGGGFAQSLLSSRVADQRKALNEVQSRHEQIQRIERSMEELFELFQEMQALLETQQEMINTIEEQAETAVVNLEEGSKVPRSTMGKAGQLRKKRKLEQETFSAAIINDADVDDEFVTTYGFSEADLGVCQRVLVTLHRDPALLKTVQLKPLRACLHSVHTALTSANVIAGRNARLSGAISDAITERRWSDAVDHLKGMRARQERVKLGSLQRWVRDCDAANAPGNADRPQVMAVLDQIMRTSAPSFVGLASGPSTVPSAEAFVKAYPAWDLGASPLVKKGDANPALQGVIVKLDKDAAAIASKFKVLLEEPGESRRPPNRYPMTLFTSQPGAILLDSKPNWKTTKYPSPHIPGAFILRDLLSPNECVEIIRAAEAIGFRPDEPISETAGAGTSILAHAVFWMVDEEMGEAIAKRALPHLAPTVKGDDDEEGERALEGLNFRFRIYRYVPGALYRPHIDGAWPRSSIGEYVYDASEGHTWSKSTFLIYLNEGFANGETTFFIPSMTEGVMDARRVTPRCGSALVFPHGAVADVLLHEGSGVKQGCKYVIRTEVLYKKA
ncbi:hypothetical protein HK101_010348 [Irineochytrium annulatum]|nr:hypothetical protein HK101_010348 [Irineochytrium annulatum]